MIKNLLVSLAVLCSTVLGVAAFVPASASAQGTGCNNGNSTSFFGFPTWYKYLCVSGKDVTLPTNPDTGKTDVGAAITLIGFAVFEIILRLGGLIAVIFVIVGGFQYITSQGEPDRLKGARSTIINALIGLVITISATVIVSLVAGAII